MVSSKPLQPGAPAHVACGQTWVSCVADALAMEHRAMVTKMADGINRLSSLPPWENKWVNNPTACLSSKSRASSVLKCLLSNPLNDYSAHNSARLFTARSSILFQCLDRTPWACATFTLKNFQFLYGSLTVDDWAVGDSDSGQPQPMRLRCLQRVFFLLLPLFLQSSVW